MPSKEKMDRIKNTVASAAKSLAQDDVYSRAKKRLKDYKAGKLGRIAKLKRTAKELIGGKKTYLPKKKKKAKPVSLAKPKRTSAAGLLTGYARRSGGK